MRKIILSLTLLTSLAQTSTIEISMRTLAHYKKTIDPFIANKKQELNKLLILPNGDSFLGMITNFCVESVFSLLGYGSINLEQGKIFLGRVFSDEKKLQNALENLETQKENISFIEEIFKRLPQDVIAKKNKGEFYAIVRQTKHSNVPNPKQMGDKTSNGSYTLTDEHFYQFAACTFMSFHIFEMNIKNSPKKKRPKTMEILI